MPERTRTRAIALFALGPAADSRWAELLAAQRRSGRALPIKDSLIAKNRARAGFTVVTRNVRDFRTTGVKVLDPFR